MKIEEIDNSVKSIAAKKRQELENRYLTARIKRCERGLPISREWKISWNNFIDKSIMRAITDYLAST